MLSLDSAIVDAYTDRAVPADRIVADPQLAARFCDAVNRHLPAAFQVDPATLIKRLLNLRRRGEASGGLPQVRRRGAGCRPVLLR